MFGEDVFDSIAGLSSGLIIDFFVLPELRALILS